MRRFFQPAPAIRDGMIVLTGAEAHHAAQVIRLRTGETAIILDGCGGEHFCTTTSVARREVTLRVDRTILHEPPSCRVRLVPAITRGKSFEVILQKAVELGAGEIQPLLCERVVARPGREEFNDKRDKWRQILVEAAKQCGACWLPGIFEPLRLTEVLTAGCRSELRLVATLGAGALHPRRVFEDYFQVNRRLPKSVSIWIGPEGDFTAAEVEQLVDSGAKPITLGAQVLRSETAAVSALAIVNHELTSPR